jgi:hypothetical protein
MKIDELKKSITDGGLNGLQEDAQPSGDKVSDEGKFGET